MEAEVEVAFTAAVAVAVERMIEVTIEVGSAVEVAVAMVTLHPNKQWIHSKEDHTRVQYFGIRVGHF